MGFALLVPIHRRGVAPRGRLRRSGQPRQRPRALDHLSRRAGAQKLREELAAVSHQHADDPRFHPLLARTGFEKHGLRRHRARVALRLRLRFGHGGALQRLRPDQFDPRRPPVGRSGGGHPLAKEQCRRAARCALGGRRPLDGIARRSVRLGVVERPKGDPRAPQPGRFRRHLPHHAAPSARNPRLCAR